MSHAINLSTTDCFRDANYVCGIAEKSSDVIDDGSKRDDLSLEVARNLFQNNAFTHMIANYLYGRLNYFLRLY